MSVSLILVPLAIALGATTGTTVVSAAAATTAVVGSKAVLAAAAEAQVRHLNHLRELYEKSNRESLSPIETIFNDATLLRKTLEEHGLLVNVVSENQLVCELDGVKLNYFRNTSREPFSVSVIGLQNIDDFINEMECFEQEYKQNVQSYTYNRLVENVGKNNMKISEETLLEDNSILLTINI